MGILFWRVITQRACRVRFIYLRVASLRATVGRWNSNKFCQYFSPENQIKHEGRQKIGDIWTRIKVSALHAGKQINFAAELESKWVTQVLIFTDLHLTFEIQLCINSELPKRPHWFVSVCQKLQCYNRSAIKLHKIKWFLVGVSNACQIRWNES